MTWEPFKPSTTTPDSSPSQSPCWPGSLCGASPCCKSAPVTSATTVVLNESAGSESKNDSAESTRSVLDSYATIQTLLPHPDNRGNVRETFRASWFPQVPPIRQLVRSESKPKTLRGMHLHRKQWDIWHFVQGRALVRTLDRDGGEGFFEADPGFTIAIPPGVSHGFYTEHGCTLLYALTEEYDGSDEFGWYPFDRPEKRVSSQLSIRWPTDWRGLNISDRDVRAPRLAEFEG